MHNWGHVFFLSLSRIKSKTKSKVYKCIQYLEEANSLESIWLPLSVLCPPVLIPPSEGLLRGPEQAVSKHYYTWPVTQTLAGSKALSLCHSKLYKPAFS